MTTEKLSFIGKRLPRADAVEKVTGKAKFICDIQLPMMLHAKVLRSPHAHAKIKKIDTSKAEKLSGVRCILTYKDVPKVHPRAMQDTHDKVEYLLNEVVRYHGEAVALIAADTEEIAEKALELVNVEYEVLPAVFDAEEAMKPNAPLVHTEPSQYVVPGTNLYRCIQTTKEGILPLTVGDVDKGFAEADYIVENTYETPMQYNCPPTPRSVICDWTGDRLTIWPSTQMPHVVARETAMCLNLPLSHVRAISTYVDGGYGGKTPEEYAALTAILAKRTGRPVRLAFTREEDIIGTYHRSHYEMQIKVGVKKDGTITAIHTKCIENFGRDPYYDITRMGTSAVGTCSMQYRWKNSKFEGWCAYTNIVDSGGMNGYGDPEANLCLERMMDEVAEKIGMDPVEFRVKNCMKPGDKATGAFWVWMPKFEWGVLDQSIASFPECIQRAAEVAHWKEKWKGWKTPVQVNGTKRMGIGIAIGLHSSLLWGGDSAIVKMNVDGTANILSNGPEIGQGLKTAMHQVVAETLGLYYEDISSVLSDTGVCPRGDGVFGSRGTVAVIGAAKRAAEDAKQKMFRIAAEKLDVKPEELETKDRVIYMRSNPERRVSIAEVCQIGFQIEGFGMTPTREEDVIDPVTGKHVPGYAVCATVAEVEVDIETGELKISGIWTAHDCGRAINPQIVENQICLSVIQSIGNITTEGLIIDKNTGAVLNRSLRDYKIPYIRDIPKSENFKPIYVEVPTPYGPFGAKGMSETASSSTGPAIANAVYNAIGVRIRGDKVSPEEILRALGKIN